VWVNDATATIYAEFLDIEPDEYRRAAYCGAKHACKGFTETVITELKHRGSNVRVTMMHLPALNTPQFTRFECEARRKRGRR